MNTDPILIGFCGLARSGKSTAAEYLAEAYGFEVVSFAQALKEMLESLFAERGVDYSALYEPALKEQPLPAVHGATARQLMQSLGDWGRSVHPDFWLTALQQRAGLWTTPAGVALTPVHDRICIDDVRYPNEAAWITGAAGGTLVHLLRAQALPPLHVARAQLDHSSERHAHDLGAQVTLVNNSTTSHGLHELLDGAMASLGIEPRPQGAGWPGSAR
jgi:hypothetical protein